MVLYLKFYSHKKALVIRSYNNATLSIFFRNIILGHNPGKGSSIVGFPMYPERSEFRYFILEHMIALELLLLVNLCNYVPRPRFEICDEL